MRIRELYYKFWTQSVWMVMSSKLGEALVGSEITRDHQRKVGEAGSSTGPVV